MVHSFLVSFSGFGIRPVLVSENGAESILSTPVFWKRLQRICWISYLNLWWNSPVSPSWPGVSCLEVIINSVSLLDVGCLFLFVWLVTNCAFQGTGLFYLDYQVCGHSMVHSIPLWPHSLEFLNDPIDNHETGSNTLLSFLILLTWVSFFLC